jgi:hypothetical protein
MLEYPRNTSRLREAPEAASLNGIMAYQAALLTGDLAQRYLGSSVDDVWGRMTIRRSRSSRSCRGINCCP